MVDAKLENGNDAEDLKKLAEDRRKALQEEELFADQIENTNNPEVGYLGVRQVMEALVRDCFDKTNTVLSKKLNANQISGSIRVIATEMADVLMGQEAETYPPVRNWNTPKGIASYLRKNFGVTETNNEQAVEQGVLLMLEEYTNLLEVLMVPGTLDQQIRSELDQLALRWTSIWMGTWVAERISALQESDVQIDEEKGESGGEAVS